ncbi:MAG: fasciclin domain-containing protein [Mycobacteriaceae bacterium]
MISSRKAVVAASVAAVAALGLVACSDDSSTTSDRAGSSMNMSSSTSMAPSSSPAMADPGSDLVGAACADYAAQVPSGPGSVAGMATSPVAVAASNNPLLTTLVAAVSGKLNPNVNLVDTLNGGEFTVFAPVDSAFAKIDPATIETLKTDTALLTKILTYHVVPGKIAPKDIDGTLTTVQGGTLAVTGTGNDIKVNGTTSVVCGGVKTANATVYLVDSVLLPAA